MKFLMEIELDNASFTENPYELYDLLTKVAVDNLNPYYGSLFSIRDSYGNAVGFYTILDDNE